MDVGNNNTLRIGDKVDISIEGDVPCRTLIEDITPDGQLVISPPLRRGLPLILRRNQHIELYFHRDNGIYSINVGVHDFSISNNVRLVILNVLSRPKKRQRRDSYRLPVERPTTLLRESDGVLPASRKDEVDKSLLIPAFVENLSSGGMLTLSRLHLPVEERLWAELKLNWPNEQAAPVYIYCKVVQSQYDGERRMHKSGIQFMEFPRGDGDTITKFILHEQQRNIRWQRALLDE